MSPTNSSLLAIRRSIAVGLWSLLVFAKVLVSSNVSIVLSFFILLLVSIFSSIALLLIEGISPGERNSTGQQRYASAAVSLTIPLCWAMLLGGRNSLLVEIGLTVMALIPVTVVWMALMSRRPIAAQQFKRATTTEPLSIEPISIELPAEVHLELHLGTNSANDDLSDEEFAESCSEESSFGMDTTSSPDVTQWLTRSLTPEAEIIEGGVRIDFAAGQRDATVHVSFCPPFRSVPDVTTEDLDGLDLEIRVAATFPFGARLTVRRPITSNERAAQNPAEACRIGFVAVTAPIRKAA